MYKRIMLFLKKLLFISLIWYNQNRSFGAITERIPKMKEKVYEFLKTIPRGKVVT